ncbi:hypothetical protein [Streptomyces sp. NPDC001675]
MPLALFPHELPRPIREYGSLKVRTRVYRREHGFLWHRTRRHRTTADDPLGCFTGNASLVPGTRQGDTFAYLLEVPFTLGEVVLQAWDKNDMSALSACFTEVGTLLRRVRTSAPAPSSWPPPLGASHLRDWLRHPDRADPGARHRLHVAMRDSIGSARMGELDSWVDQLTRPAKDSVPLHGEFSLSALVAGRDGGPVRLLIGETVARGPLEYDVGWVLGELAEWSDLAAEDDTRLDALGRALLCAAGPRVDLGRLGRVVVLRRLMHVIDYASYVGWSELLVPYIESMPELIDSHGTSTLTRMHLTDLWETPQP